MNKATLTYRLTHLLFMSIVITLFTVGCRSSNVMTINENPQPETPSDSLTVSEPRSTTREDTLRTRLMEAYKDELLDEYRSDANRLTNFHVQAQQLFFQADYDEALILANRALSIRENAFTLSLRGSIYLGLGDIRRFEDDWRRALEIDENVPIPRSEYIISALKNYGIIDDNLRRRN